MEAHNFFLTLAVLLLAARFLSELAIRIGVPAVIGELAAGLIIGPSLLGLVSPDATMKLLAEIGIILLLFEVGMDTDVFRLAKAGSKPIVVAIAGVVFPFGSRLPGQPCDVWHVTAGQPVHRRHPDRHQYRHYRAGADRPAAPQQ